MVDSARAPHPGPAHPRLHILLLDPLLRDGSSAGPTRTYDLATRLAAAGHRITVLTTTQAWTPLDGNSDGTYRGALSPDVEVHALRLPKSSSLTAGATQPGRYARWAAVHMWRVAAIDAVIAVAEPYWLLPLAAFFAWWRGVPLIADVRELPPDPPPPMALRRERIVAALAHVGRRAALLLPRRTFAASQTVMTALTALGVGPGRLTQTTLGCDARLFTVSPGHDNTFLRAFPDLAGGPLLVFAGRFTAERDLVAVVNLGAALREWAPDVTVILCGDGPAQATLEEHARAAGVADGAVRIIPPLPRRDLPDLLAAATLVLSVPQRNDTAGGFFDALAAGRPVLVFGDNWQRSLVESRGAGYGLPAGNPSAVAREIVEILRDGDGLRRAGQQAAALAAGRFNIERVLGEQRGAIEALIAEMPRADVLRRRTLTAKRACDIILSAALLVLLSPVLLVLAIAVAIKIGRPPLVMQARVGLKGRIFKSIRFRTLSNAEDATGALLSDEHRRSGFGDVLDTSGLAALPELLNVLRGTMSFVGPAPLPPAYLPYYTPAQRRRHDLRPGLTGLAQLESLTTANWEDVFARDVAYVDDVSLGLDMTILAKTVLNVLRGNGFPRFILPAFDDIMARREGAEDV